MNQVKLKTKIKKYKRKSSNKDQKSHKLTSKNNLLKKNKLTPKFQIQKRRKQKTKFNNSKITHETKTKIWSNIYNSNFNIYN